jgi:A/G-specific adenine glycosylase
MPAQLAPVVRDWYAAAARDLPWRAPGVTPWGVLVSEVMLQQTPVVRVLPAWRSWLARWPEPADLAAAAPGDAVRAWDRLGYPRRALRLHAAARAIVDRHGGRVPDSEDELRALPGIGAYTAAAVVAFAFGGRTAVLDTNVRRVYARLLDGRPEPTPTITVAERKRALALVPCEDPGGYAVAVMELGALVCTARTPRCDDCPVQPECAWWSAGRPAAVTRRRAQAYAGTDRQVRGRLLAVLRTHPDPVGPARLVEVWQDAEQRERALAGLLADGLAEATADGRFRLPV